MRTVIKKLGKPLGKSVDQEFSKEFGSNAFGQNSHGTPQTGKGYDITIPTGLEPGE